MNEVGFERAVREFLRADYGITDARVVPGGKHKRLEFTSPGGTATVFTTWPRYPVGGDWGITLDVKRKDLRNRLGEPRPQPPSKKKEPPPMTVVPALADHVRAALPSLAAQLEAPVAPPPTRTLIGWALGCYHYAASNDQGRITLPRGDLDLFPDRRALIERVSDDTWRLRPGSQGAKVSAPTSGDKFSIYFGLTSAAGLGQFGLSPAEATVAPDGSILVRSPVSTRVPVDASKGFGGRRKQATPAPTVAAVKPTTDTLAPEDIRRCLALIRRVEAETEYRLVKSKELNDWVFISRID